MNNGSIIHAVHDTRFGLVSIYVLLIYGTNLFVNSSHKFNVQGFQSVTSWSDKVETGMNS
jgi:hypothetical protein